MIYNLPELIESHPELRQAMFDRGQIRSDRMRIELPDDFDFGANKPKPILRGLGDVVAIAAKPIAFAIDAVTHGTPIATNLLNCGTCAERQEALNKAFPIK